MWQRSRELSRGRCTRQEGNARQLTSMDNSALHPDANLVEVLVARAREASDGRLVLDVVGGLALALVFVLWRPSVWLVPFGVGVCLLSFGTWGISDRELGERAGAPSSSMTTVLRVGRIAATI